MSLMGNFYSSPKVLELPTVTSKTVRCPTTKSLDVKRFIVEKPAEVKEPDTLKKEIKNPLQNTVIKKHAIRMIVLRRRKMKKHQLKRLWERMYLKFRANRILREKTKELEFRGRLASKVSSARKFSAEKYVEDYLTDYHTQLTPKSYKGKRLPEWLIKELMEQDIVQAKEDALRGREVTSGDVIVKPGETVKDFIARTWNK